MKIIDFPSGLTFHKRSQESEFYTELKKILNLSRITFFDPCCLPAEGAAIYPTRVNNGVLEAFNGSAWVAAVSKDVVTQITSKTTGVALNVNAGVVTTVALTDAADTSFQFTVTNSLVSATSNIQLSVVNSGAGVAVATVTSIGSGSFVVRVNNAGVAAFNSVLKLHFLIS